jgi:hypothetical protein
MAREDDLARRRERRRAGLRAAGTIARGVSFPSMASGRDDFPREITSVYSSESVGRENYGCFLFLPIQSRLLELL